MIAAVGIAQCAPPPLAVSGGIAITDGYAFASVGSGASAFLVIANEGRVEDTLVLAESPAAEMVMPHETEVAGGAGRMVHLETIPIPAGGSIAMRSGGLHLMMSGVRRPLVVGDSCELSVTLARAGVIRVKVPVVGFSDRP